MCHHNDPREWTSLRETLADRELDVSADESTDDSDEPAGELDREKRPAPVPPADD